MQSCGTLRAGSGKGIYTWHFAKWLSDMELPVLKQNFWLCSDDMLIQRKILHYSVTSESLSWVFWYWNVVVLVLSKKGLTLEDEHMQATGKILYTGEIVLSSYSIQIGLFDSASAKIKAIGVQLPAECYLLGSHSSHKISQHSAALLCEACDCCHVLRGMVGKVQWCSMCWPQRGPSLVVLCQCSCPQCNAQVMPRKGKHVLSLLPPPVLIWPVGWWHRRSPVLL